MDRRALLVLASAATGLLGPGCRSSAPESAAAANAPPADAREAGGSGDGRDDFERAPSGAPPPGYSAATTVGDPRFHATLAKWAVVEDAAAPSGRRVVKLAETKNREELFNVLLREQPRLADVELAVRIRADAGADDRGGGLVWRAQDAANYYLCRWNPLEKNLRAYRVAAGKRIQLQSVTIETDAAAWHALAVRMKGRVIEISFDDRKVISCADPSYIEAGMVGLWTKGDAQSSFDDLRIEPAK